MNLGDLLSYQEKRQKEKGKPDGRKTTIKMEENCELETFSLQTERIH
jgi:hypothetical protein